MLNYKTKHFSLSIADNGTVSSLKLQSGKELLKESRPVMTLQLKDNSEKTGTMTAQKDRLCFDFGKHGTAALRIQDCKEYLKLIIEDIKLQDFKELRPLDMAPSCCKYNGTMGGMLSDDKNMVCLRSLGLKGGVRVAGKDASHSGNVVKIPANETISLQSFTEDYMAEDGVSFALVAAPRGKMIDILRYMTDNEPVPKSLCGGAWSMDAQQNRGSYLWTEFLYSDVDNWLKIAKRGGFRYIHLHGWWKTLGHYDVKKEYYPNGLEDMKRAVDKINEAGLNATFHTLTACIQPDDTWVSPVPSDDLIATYTYTLSKPMSMEDDVIYVDELPGPDHEVVFSYSCNGNAIKIGKEIIQYSEICREKPYAFKKCIRGAFGTAVSNHKAGDRVDYLRQRYIAFYPKPDSELGEKLSDSIADKFKYVGLKGMYYDGSEGMGKRYDIDAMRWKIFRKLPQDSVIEASCWGHNSWWFHSRIGAYDFAVWGVKKQHAAHTKICGNFRMSNLLTPQMGWWAAIGPLGNFSRSQFIDEMEYFANKNLAVDGPMSLLELNPGKNQWNGRIFDMLTLLGWHERLRLANYFCAGDLKRIAALDKEFSLRLGDNGRWNLIPQFISKKRMTNISAPAAMTVSNSGGSKFRLRLEALYQAKPSSECSSILKFRSMDDFDLRGHADFVTVNTKVIPASSDSESGILRIHAENNGTEADGAWVQEGIFYGYPFKPITGSSGFGLWVKGDNSGALLNIQFCNPSQYARAQSDHYLRLDFSGWKHFEFLFRERDTEYMEDHKWPYDTSAGNMRNCRTELKTNTIGEISIFLNDIPVKGCTDIEIRDIEGLELVDGELSSLSVAVNGREIEIPASLKSGEYIEIDENGIAEHFCLNGWLKNRFPVKFSKGAYPRIRRGENQFAVKGKSIIEGLTPRAELTVFTEGRPFGTPSDNVDWALMDEEYEMPRTIFNLDGQDNSWTVNRRDYAGASPNDIPAVDMSIEIESAGAEMPADTENCLLDDFSDAKAYMHSPSNDYARFTGGSVSNAKVDMSCTSIEGGVHFHAKSNRGSDNIGWASIGHVYAEPLDLSSAEGIGLLMNADINQAYLKIKICDADGCTHEIMEHFNGYGRRFVEIPLLDAKIDRSRIVCIVYSLVNLMCGNRPASVDLLSLVKLDKCAVLDTPVLSVNGSCITIPCAMYAGYELHCTGMKTWKLVDGSGAVIGEGKVKGRMPKLLPGANDLELDFKKKTDSCIRATVNIVKNYGK